MEESGEIEMHRDEKPPRAIVNMYFTIKHEEKEIWFERSHEEFVLTQNSAGKWKIVGWRLTEE